MSEEIKEVHIKNYDEWLKYYENATKEQVIEDLTQDVKYFADAVKDIKYLQKENERLNNIINKALGIANERVNHYYHINKKEILEDWEDIFNVLIERDNQELKGSESNE